MSRLQRWIAVPSAAFGLVLLSGIVGKSPAFGQGLRAVARLRLASLQTGDKAYDEALKTLSASFPADFVPLAADRRAVAGLFAASVAHELNTPLGAILSSKPARACMIDPKNVPSARSVAWLRSFRPSRPEGGRVMPAPGRGETGDGRP